jgi:hypothetical protein
MQSPSNPDTGLTSAVPRRQPAWPAAFATAIAALVFSNGWWVYNTVDNAVFDKFEDADRRRTCGALKQTLAILPLVSAQADRASLVGKAQSADPFKLEPFDDAGQTVVGGLALTFDATGRLTHAEPTWEPFECRP